VGLRSGNLTAGNGTNTANANAVYDFPGYTYRIGAATTSIGLPVDIAASVLVLRAISTEESDLIRQTLAEELDFLYSISI
jgi:hypothetical protein